MPSQRKSNPTEVHISLGGRDLVQRKLVLRNTSGKDFVLKLSASQPAAVAFPTNVFRFPPHAERLVEFRVDARHADKQRLTIRGHVVPVYSRALKTFIEQKTSPGTQAQEAFSLRVVFSEHVFSAPQTVINLPGAASCVDSSDHPCDVVETDTTTAVNIEKDLLTAKAIGSMMGVVEEYKKRNEAKKSKSCWLTSYICGGAADDEKKSMRSKRSSSLKSQKSQMSQKSQKSCRQQKQHQKSALNVGLEATPCGGSAIQA